MKMAVEKPSSLLDTRVVYCGDNLDQFRRLPRPVSTTCAPLHVVGV